MSASNTTKPRVLIVDDDPQMLNILALILLKNGYEVLKAENALAAISMIVRKVPDLIVADIGMPIVDGLALVRELKATSDTDSIPIVSITGMNTPECREAALEAGCSAFLTKPVAPEVLLNQVSVLLRNRNANPT